MNSSNSEVQSYQKQPNMLINSNLKTKKKKDYICPCGRSYGSYPALYSHIKRKHNGKAPGDVIKPKPLRRRGRPFKYEPVKLQGQNYHKNASRHLGQYLRNVQREDVNQFPLKQFAQQDLFRLPFTDVGTEEGKLQRYQHLQAIRNNTNAPIRNKTSLRQGVNFHDASRSFPVSNDVFQGQNMSYNPQRMNEEEKPTYTFSNQHRQERVHEQVIHNSFLQHQNMRNLHDYSQFLNQQANVQSQLQKSHLGYQNLRPYLQQRKPQPQMRSEFDAFQSIYSKPFELGLNEQMQEKIRPIVQGISDFLQPILKQILNAEESQKMEKGGQQNADRNDDNDALYQVNLKGNEVNKTDPLRKSNYQGGAGQDHLEKNEYRIEYLLQNEHFRNILKWVMSPPEDASSRQRENYIEFSFRSCLVEFLDFVHNFLETVQYEQVLLLLVFFCDHILQVTASFELRPEPQVYEMGLYFNSFINEYLPKLITYLPVLEKFYLFAEFKKKTSELFMWLSSWQAMQQYYHNRHYREMIAYEISQQNYKCILYQKKYQSYIREADRHNIQRESEVFHPVISNHSDAQVQQKTEDNPELIILPVQNNTNNLNPQNQRNNFNPQNNINNVNPQNPSVNPSMDEPSQNSQQIQVIESEHQIEQDSLESLSQEHSSSIQLSEQQQGHFPNLSSEKDNQIQKKHSPQPNPQDHYVQPQLKKDISNQNSPIPNQNSPIPNQNSPISQ